MPSTLVIIMSISMSMSISMVDKSGSFLTIKLNANRTQIFMFQGNRNCHFRGILFAVSRQKLRLFLVTKSGLKQDIKSTSALHVSVSPSTKHQPQHWTLDTTTLTTLLVLRSPDMNY
jgi:hypothetical protein